MAKADLYSIKGVRKGSIRLPELFNQKINKYLLAQAIRVYKDRSHSGLSKTKTRGEVSISTRKIYRQKGTGYARHGAKSAPIFVGGGIAHGPKGVKRTLVLPKKLKHQALASALSLKVKKGALVLVDSLNLLKKTKDADILIDKLLKTQGGKVKKATVVLSNDNKLSNLYFRNLSNVEIRYFSNLNAYDAFYGGLIILDIKIIQKNKVTPKIQKVIKPAKKSSIKPKSNKTKSQKLLKIKEK